MVVGLPQPQYGGSVWNRLIRIVPYSLPLFVVYFAEYACQSGVWITIGRSEVARRRFYMGANIVCVSEVEISVRSLAYVLTRCTRSFIRYQIGVFLSRSSGSVVSLSVCQLPWLAAFQFGLMLFFIVVSALEISGVVAAGPCVRDGDLRRSLLRERLQTSCPRLATIRA